MTPGTPVKIVAGLLLVLVCAGFSREAWAGLYGQAELGYVSYDLKAWGRKFVDADSFWQNYSIGFAKQSVSRAQESFRYNLDLGYEWYALKTDVDNRLLNGPEHLKVRSGQLRYLGEVVYDPPLLPLRFNAFSRDTTQAMVNYDTATSLQFDQRFAPLIDPNLPTDVLNSGKNIESGLTLILGVKNGLSGAYNRLFDFIPMIFVDYRDDRVTSEPTPLYAGIDTHRQKLAFVSLNKKDNWFHYRTEQYTDHINPTSNFTDQQLQLGTIDERLRRRWIDMTNWIRISADGQFFQRKAADITGSFEEYDLNLFAIASRRKWEARTFSNLNRNVDYQGTILNDRNLPVYVNGIYDLDTDWSFRFNNDELVEKRLSGLSKTTSNLGGELRVNTFKRANFTVSPHLAIERTVDTTSSEGINVSGGIESTSTRRFSRNLTLAGGYTFTYYKTDFKDGREENKLKHDVHAWAAYNPVPTVRLTLEQTLQASNAGEGQVQGTIVSNNDILSPVDRDLPGFSTEGSYLSSQTTASVEWDASARLRTTLRGTMQVTTEGGKSAEKAFSLMNSIDYAMPALAVSLQNSFASVSGRTDDLNVRSYLAMNYKPSRIMSANLYARFDLERTNGTTQRRLDLSQTFNYTLLQSRGKARSLVNLSEEFKYLATYTNPGIRTTEAWVAVGAFYYPTSQIILSASTKYTFEELPSIEYGLGAAVLYSKFQAAVDYRRATRSSDNRTENRFEAKVRKTF